MIFFLYPQKCLCFLYLTLAFVWGWPEDHSWLTLHPLPSILFLLEFSNRNVAYSYTHGTKEKLLTSLDQNLIRVHWSSCINTNGVEPDYTLSLALVLISLCKVWSSCYWHKEPILGAQAFFRTENEPNLSSIGSTGKAFCTGSCNPLIEKLMTHRLDEWRGLKAG